MEIPLTPMEFARRARRLYAEREAVVDGDLRLTYRKFLEPGPFDTSFTLLKAG